MTASWTPPPAPPGRRRLTVVELDRVEQLFEEITGEPMLPWQRLAIGLWTAPDDRE